MTMMLDLAVVAVCSAAAILMLAFPAGRAAWARHLLLARRMYVELPLRLVTGRRRPDYRRIAALERELAALEERPTMGAIEYRAG